MKYPVATNRPEIWRLKVCVSPFNEMTVSPGHLDPVGDTSSLLGGRERDYQAQTGVVHLAVVVNDTSFQALSWRRYDRVMS